MTKKSLITIQIVDLLGNPINKAKYRVRNQKTNQLIAEGVTQSSGCIVQISRDKGTILDVYIESMFGGHMVNVKSFTMSKDRMVVKIASPKVLLDLQTLISSGNTGKYERKPHIVQSGDTLSNIAQKNHTTVRALELLNKLKDPNKLGIGQVIKIPPNIPANGNKSHYNQVKESNLKQKTEPQQNKTNPKSNSSADSKKNDPSNDEDLKTQAEQKISEWYDEAVNWIKSEPWKMIPVQQDRSQQTGTPKTSVPNLCLTKPQCISSGKSELIRELNIRLAGFGGALPTDEFTELTANCIKQFQRDYMGAPETGKICGSVLVALDDFQKKYPIDDYFNGKPKDSSVVCPCKKCDGYGSGRNMVNGGGNKVNERPGFHRSLWWAFRSIMFYIEQSDYKKKLTVKCIFSGYRCHDRNLQTGRHTVNHMGNALDIHFFVDGHRDPKATYVEDSINYIRNEICVKKLNAKPIKTNKFMHVEPEKYPNSKGATNWIHLDTNEFKEYHDDQFYKKDVNQINGLPFSDLMESLKIKNLFSCSGQIIIPNQKTDQNDQRIPIKDLAFSAKGKKFLAEFEKPQLTTDGKSTYYYNDGKAGLTANSGYCTIGYGHLVKGQVTCQSLGIKPMVDKISLDEAEKLFEHDIKTRAVDNVKASITVPLYQHEFDALVILAYNCKLLKKEAPKLCRLINSKDYINGPKEMLDITKSGGAVMKGLVIRRELEYKMFTENKYINFNTKQEIK